jgi:transcriptional regulator with XRE-family HTH domain
MVTLRNAIGHTIKQLRLDNGLTVRELSARAYMSYGHLSDVERGDKDISYAYLDSVAKNGLRIPTEELMKAVVAFMEQENK